MQKVVLFCFVISSLLLAGGCEISGSRGHADVMAINVKDRHGYKALSHAVDAMYEEVVDEWPARNKRDNVVLLLRGKR